jgi:glutamine amidotransferase
MADKTPRVAIVDFDLGNLFSVEQACRVAGIDAFITQNAKEVVAADAIILPGVGGFPRAMSVLKQRDLISSIKDVAQSGRLIVGICLGMQLLMDGSTEFGHTDGLGLIAGNADRLPNLDGGNGRTIPIPNVGWSEVTPAFDDAWSGTPLSGTRPGTRFYFVHSFFVTPRQNSDALAMSKFGPMSFCAAVRRENILGFQFHPERSGEVGLQVYRSLPPLIDAARGKR